MYALCCITIADTISSAGHKMSASSVIIPYSGFYLQGPELCELCERLWACII